MKTEPQENRLDFKFKATEGLGGDTRSQYGIYAAELVGMPDVILGEARKISSALTQEDESLLAQTSSPGDQRARKMINLLNDLDNLKSGPQNRSFSQVAKYVVC